MRIFGGILPYIGFNTYIVGEDDEYDTMLVKVLELAWFNYTIGFVYKSELYEEELY